MDGSTNQALFILLEYIIAYLLSGKDKMMKSVKVRTLSSVW